MDMTQAIASKWMANTDVPVEGVNLTIKGVTQEAVGEMLETKYALRFHGDYKPLLLNKTNIRILISMLGQDSSTWTGKKVNVFNDLSVSYQGKVGGTRVRPAAQESAPASVQGLSPEELAAAAAAYRRAQEGRKTVDELADDIAW